MEKLRYIESIEQRRDEVFLSLRKFLKDNPMAVNKLSKMVGINRATLGNFIYDYTAIDRSTIQRLQVFLSAQGYLQE